MSVETVQNPYAPPAPAEEVVPLDDVKTDVLDEIWDLEEVACEVKHVYSSCTHVVRWRVPATPCGCEGPLLACQGAHDWLAGMNPLQLVKCWCGFEAEARHWLRGWVKI